MAAGCADAVFFRESELLRILWAGLLFDSDGNVDLDRLGVDQLEVEVAQGQRDGTPWCFKVRTREEAIAAVAKLRVGSLAENVAGSPDASPADLADQGRSYATKFWATLGDPNGQRLFPGARGYTVYRLQPNGHRGERVFGRESYGPVMATALGLPLPDGHLPGGTRDEFGFSEPRASLTKLGARLCEQVRLDVSPSLGARERELALGLRGEAGRCSRFVTYRAVREAEHASARLALVLGGGAEKLLLGEAHLEQALLPLRLGARLAALRAVREAEHASAHLALVLGGGAEQLLLGVVQ